jgi:GTP-binding protein
MCKEANKSYRLQSEKRHRKGASKARVGSHKKINSGGAIVSSTPGTTRDRRECIGRIGGTYFTLVDTAGVDGRRIDTRDPLEKKMLEQTLEAARQADLILLMVDARVGVTTDLVETARWLRKVKQGEVVVLANKLEGDGWSYAGSPVLENIQEAARVGFGEPLLISAEHGEGMADIAVVIEELTRKKRESLGLSLEEDNSDTQDQIDKPLQLAILGRQNVGKSTLVNTLLQTQRVISGATPGLTRDAISIEWEWNSRPVKLVDTAGIRKMTKRDYSDEIEDLSVQDAMRAMKIADVAVLVLDADARHLQRQELVIADAVVREGRALVVAANKMDLLVNNEYTAEDFASAVTEHIETRFPILRKTPVVAMSSLTGDGVDKLMPVVFNARDRWARTISTGTLNRWLSEVLLSQSPPMQNGRVTKIKYIIQTKGRPPTFLLFGNVNELPGNYLRFLTRQFQDSFGLFGMEVRMAVKKNKTNPFERRQSRTGSGLGGKEARKKRNVSHLKSTGTSFKRRGRRRKTS